MGKPVDKMTTKELYVELRAIILQIAQDKVGTPNVYVRQNAIETELAKRKTKELNSGLDPWGFCTHHHGDERDAQVGPCPLHDAIGYCQICAQFLFTKEELKKHSELPKHYVHMFQRK